MDGAIVVSGATVRSGQEAREVVVMPRRMLEDESQAGGRVEHRDAMAWVELK